MIEKMKPCKLLTSIKETINYLDMLNIMSDTNHINQLSPKKYSDKYYQTFHEGDYYKTFVVASENRDYDIRLQDGSLFQFTSTSEYEINYSFMHRIEDIISFKEFSEKYPYDNDELIERNYEYYLVSNKTKLYSCPIRYDVSKSEYKEVYHSYAHMHFGINTDIRIPVNKIISPLHFVDFIIKNMYKTEWNRVFNSNEKFKRIVNSLKSQSKEIQDKFFSDEEKKLLYIT